MKKLLFLLAPMMVFSIIGFSQNGQYDVRLNLNDYDCNTQKLFIDIDVKASSAGETFRIAEQNYRFTYDANAIGNPVIVEEGTISGFTPHGGNTFSLYDTHSLGGSIVGNVSYNVVLAGGEGLLIETDWVNVGTISFDVFDSTIPFDLNWNTHSDFPPTFISEAVNGFSIPIVEGMYVNDMESISFAEICTPDDPCGGTSSTDSLSYISENDIFIDGVGFANNPSVTFTDAGTPANAVLSDISLELYFRLAGSSCENEIAIQLTDPAGNTQALTAYTTCNGGTGLYYVNLDVPSGSTTGNMDNWVVEFDDTNDQNAGYEYSVRFARLNYVATTAGGGGGVPVVNQVIDFADSDLFINGVGFANNGTYTFSDPGTPADAVLSNISLELYFKLTGNSCENEIAIQITDPAGNTQPLTAYTTCNGGTGLYYVNLNVPSGSTTGSVADWVVEFDDTNDQNAGYEYSVRFGRLTYTTTHTTGGGTPVTVNDTVSDYADADIFVDGVGFANNGTYTFSDPGTPADAVLSNISLELYFKLTGSSCENEIAIQITDPAGNTQPLTAYTTCNGGTGLYYVDLNVPNGNTTGSVADWTVEFDDTNDQNTGYEYSVRFGRLTYDTEYTECVPTTSAQQHVNTSAHKNVNTSIRQHSNTPMKLYPVPASQHLNVEYFSEKANPANIEILSNDGKMLMSEKAALQEGLNTIQMNITDLSAGHYHIRMYNADDVQMQSFIKITP